MMAYIMLYEICKFESSTITNDIITKNNSKQFGPPRTKQIICHSKSIDKSYPKMFFLWNMSHYVKRYAHFCEALAFFMMSAY